MPTKSEAFAGAKSVRRTSNSGGSRLPRAEALAFTPFA